MSVEFKVPFLGENIKTATVVRVMVQEGDVVAKDQPVVEVETDKAALDVPIDITGRIVKVHVAVNAKVNVGQVLLTIEESASASTPAPKSPETPTKAAAAQTKPSPAPTPAPPAPPAKPTTPAPAAAPPLKTTPSVPSSPVSKTDSREVIASPATRRLAREVGVDLSLVPASGSGGRITEEDVKAFVRAQRAVATPSPATDTAPSTQGLETRETMSNIRRITAERLASAWATIPHVTQFDSADITDLEALRKETSRTLDAKLTMTAILVSAVAALLKAFPKFNASIDMTAGEIVFKQYYNIGVAVDTERGLLVPVIRDADRKSVAAIAKELSEKAERARAKKITPDELAGGTFTITNLGGIGGRQFTPIVNPPEVAILGVDRSSVEPVYRDGGFLPRLLLPLALSYDHRLIDGADGARFMTALVKTLQDMRSIP